MEKNIKGKLLQIRISEFDKNRLKYLADRYAGGSMTKWILHGINEAPRVDLVKLEENAKKKEV